MSLTKDDLREIKTVMTETIMEVVPVILQPRFDAIDERFDAMDARMDSMNARFDAMDVRFEMMEERFDSMEARFDRTDVTLAEIRAAGRDQSRRIARLERET